MPRREDDGSPFTVHHRDARLIGQTLDEALGSGPDAERLMATVTSPPYFNLLNYGGTEQQIGFGQQYDEYLGDCQSVFGQIYARTAEEGSLWLVADTMFDQSVTPSRLRNLPFDIADRCQKEGWTLRDVIIWHKDKARPWSQPGRLRNAFEYVLYFVKSKNFKYHLDHIREPDDLAKWWVKYPERYNPRGKAPENVWRFAIPSQGSWANTAIRHACPLPPNMVERILLLSTDPGDIVCDPFAGSGTVVAEAERLARRGLGTELNATYCRAYREIVRDEIVLRPRLNDLSGALRRSQELELQINKLRAVKFARSVWHQFRKEDENLGLPTHVIATASLAASALTPHHVQDVALLFVIDLGADKREAIQRRLKEIASAPPLTKYGISGDIRVCGRDEAVEVLGGHDLWLYEHGHTWQTSGKTEVAAFLEMPFSSRRMKYPPIASNVEVEIPSD